MSEYLFHPIFDTIMLRWRSIPIRCIFQYPHCVQKWRSASSHVDIERGSQHYLCVHYKFRSNVVQTVCIFPHHCGATLYNKMLSCLAGSDLNNQTHELVSFSAYIACIREIVHQSHRYIYFTIIELVSKTRPEVVQDLRCDHEHSWSIFPWCTHIHLHL